MVSMIPQPRKASTCVTTACFVMACVPVFWSTAFAENLIDNGGFETGLPPWTWQVSMEADATGHPDETVAHTGQRSFFLSNRSNMASHVYGHLFQRVAGLKPCRKYRISAWFKGKGVAKGGERTAGRASFGGGGHRKRRWSVRKKLPKGDFDWTQFSVEFTTYEDEDRFQLIVILEGQTEKLWVDDVVFEEVHAPVQITVRGAGRNLLAASHLYGASHEAAVVKSPVVPVADAGSLRVSHSQKGLHFSFDVHDETPGMTTSADRVFDGDSIQIAIDTAPGVAKGGLDRNCYELGFALKASGEILRHCSWRAGRDAFGWLDTEVSGEKTDTGYALRLALPWKSLNVSPETTKVLGVNVVFNNADGKGGLQRTDWRKGSGSPADFRRVVLLEQTAKRPAGLLSFSKGLYSFGTDDTIVGRYEDYAPVDAPPQTLRLAATCPDRGQVVELGETSMPPAAAGALRAVDFKIPTSYLDQGEWSLQAQLGDEIAAVRNFKILNVEAEVRERFAREKAHLERVKALAENVGLLDNVYVGCGIYIGERFVKRMENDTGRPPDGPTWRLLQFKEAEYVLDETEKLIEVITSGRSPRLEVPRPTGGPVRIAAGAFVSEVSLPGRQAYESPCYFYGYGHFSDAWRTIPEFWRIGATIIQQSKGAKWHMKQDGTYTGGTDPLDLAQEHRVKVDMMVNFHSTPNWLSKAHPDARLSEDLPNGFIKFVVDHPAVRKMCEQFNAGLAAAIKNHPALFSICLENEPIYFGSARDQWSRPLYLEFLKQRHGTIERLNELYDTSCADFDELPEPPVYCPETDIGQQRLHFDWADFNRRNFHDWFEFLNGIVKREAPDVLTHTKTITMMHYQHSCWWGYDPERMCAITDIAGNDETLYYGTTGNRSHSDDYAFDWLYQAMGNDFQHSVKGQPTFNTENHIIPDNTTDPVPPQHTQVGLWHGALHHQGATVIWVWEEPGSPGKSQGLKGSIYLRPANIYSAGLAMFDLNRLAPEVSTISAQKARVAILHPIPSLYWQDEFPKYREHVYTSLTFLGEPVEFVTERQLAREEYRDYEWIIVPHAAAVRETTVEGLAAYQERGANIVFYGDDCLTRDEYWRPRDPDDAFAAAIRIPLQESAPEFQTRLRKIFAQKGLSRVELTDPATGKHAWGVDYRVVQYGDTKLVSMVNLLNAPVTVSLGLSGRAKDLVTGEEMDLDDVTLEPMAFVLLQRKESL